MKSGSQAISTKGGNSRIALKQHEDSKSKNILRKVFPKNNSAAKETEVERDQPKFESHQKRFNDENSSVYDQLEFSDAEEVYKEILSDLNEFVACEQIFNQMTVKFCFFKKNILTFLRYEKFSFLRFRNPMVF